LAAFELIVEFGRDLGTSFSQIVVHRRLDV
jgi:hypothetical protein